MITGGCHCGSVRYSIAGEALRSALCACTDCRRSAGAPLVSWALFARDAVTVDGDPASYNSSRDVRRSFLRPLRDRVVLRERHTPDDVLPRAWVQMADAPEWLHHIDELPKFERYSGG